MPESTVKPAASSRLDQIFLVGVGDRILQEKTRTSMKDQEKRRERVGEITMKEVN